jgi:hypothetical protein
MTESSPTDDARGKGNDGPSSKLTVDPSMGQASETLSFLSVIPRDIATKSHTKDRFSFCQQTIGLNVTYGEYKL